MSASSRYQFNTAKLKQLLEAAMTSGSDGKRMSAPAFIRNYVQKASPDSEMTRSQIFKWRNEQSGEITELSCYTLAKTMEIVYPNEDWDIIRFTREIDVCGWIPNAESEFLRPERIQAIDENMRRIEKRVKRLEIATAGGIFEPHHPKAMALQQELSYHGILWNSADGAERIEVAISMMKNEQAEERMREIIFEGSNINQAQDIAWLDCLLSKLLPSNAKLSNGSFLNTIELGRLVLRNPSVISRVRPAESAVPVHHCR